MSRFSFFFFFLSHYLQCPCMLSVKERTVSCIAERLDILSLLRRSRRIGCADFSDECQSCALNFAYFGSKTYNLKGYLKACLYKCRSTCFSISSPCSSARLARGPPRCMCNERREKGCLSVFLPHEAVISESCSTPNQLELDNKS